MENIVTESDLHHFRTEGVCVLRSVIDNELLTILREECAYFLGYKDASMDHKGVTTEGLNHRGSRYFISLLHERSRVLNEFLFGDQMAEIAQALLGDNVYLFNEQWVVKGADTGMKFSWHQDSGYVKFRDPPNVHAPYLSCWCTLDDMTEQNGTVYLLPHSRGGTQDKILDHYQENKSNDLIGYTGDDSGDPVLAPAGSIACFSRYNLHRSSANTTHKMRRVYLVQYSSEPLLDSNGKLWAIAKPFLRNGKCVKNTTIDN